jgi:site-specific recombinase XerD
MIISRKVFDRYLTETQEKALFKAVDGDSSLYARRDAAWMRLLRQTGMRVGSLAGLTVADAREAISAKRLVLRPEICKRGNGYEVYLNRGAHQALKDLIKVRRDQGFPDIGSEPLIVSRHKQALSIRSLQHRMRYWCGRAGIDERVSPHWFRHTLAKRIMARSTARNPLEIVKHVLGHVSLDSTIVYAAPDKETVQRAMEEAA